MRRKAFLFSLLVIALLASCDRKARMAGLAEENIRMSMDSPDGFAITAISEPDSAFGVNYLSQHEVNGITAIMQSVTALIMDRTNNMTAFNPDDHYVMSLAERQMKAMTDLRTMVYKTNEKGEWSGWKLRVDYKAKDKYGNNYRAERWLFFDKDGKAIHKSFELPLP